jgi:hypothetical protein
MEKIKSNCIVPSSAFSVPKSKMKHYDASIKKKPDVGDLIFGEISEIGHHKKIESKSARLHSINIGTRSIFVFGNRYAPDHFEGLLPESNAEQVDLLSRGGVVGEVKTQNQLIGVPTKVRVLGYLCDSEGKVINTRNHVLLHPKKIIGEKRRAKVVLCIGTSMNSGKTYTAAACCYAISSIGKSVRAAKITGTASLRDILLMNDCGADHIADFTYFGYPSSYLLEPDKLLWMFHSFDMKYGNNPKNYLVIEFADGIFQRETAILLKMPEVRDRIHKLIFCAPDSSAVFGGIQVLKEKFDLVPDAISGLCSNSPLAIREIKTFSDLPILRSMEKDYKTIFQIIA